MGLSKYKLGTLIERVERRNVDLTYGFDDVRGCSNNKEIQPTRADISNRSFDKFLIIHPHEYVFNRRTTRMGERLGLGYNNSEKTYIFTEDYVAFQVKKNADLLSDYLYIFFLRPEFDRYVRYDSWGSATEFFNWEEMCDVTITLPTKDIQQKYVDVYNAMLANQRAYERGLDDLKLTCDAYIEELRRRIKKEAIGNYIDEINIKNTSLDVDYVRGVTNAGKFDDTKAKMDGINLTRYTLVRKNDFAYNPSRINIGSIALSYIDECIVSPMYEVFRIKDQSKLLPGYLMMWFSRSEFWRYTWFYASGSVRDTFDFNLMKEVEIPIPDINVQKSIVNIYNAFIARREINEKLKKQIKDICPILIKGSLEETKRS